VKNTPIRDMWESRPHFWESGCCLERRCSTTELLNIEAVAFLDRRQFMETVVSLFGVQPLRIGGAEIYTRGTFPPIGRTRLAARGCFSGPATPAVREYLADLPNLTLESIPAIEDSAVNGAKAVWKALSKHRPKILHFQSPV